MPTHTDRQSRRFSAQTYPDPIQPTAGDYTRHQMRLLEVHSPATGKLVREVTSNSVEG